VVMASLPWTVMYASIFFASRLFGPAMIPHVAKLKEADLSYWAITMCSMVNSFVLTPLGYRACKESGYWNADAPFTVSSQLGWTCCVALCGYTLWDSIILIYYRKEWTGINMYIMHHIGVFAAWGTAAATGLVLNIVVPICVLEATGPFVNLRWLLSTAGLKDSKLYIYNGAVMFVSYFLLRVVFNTWLCFTRLWVQRDALFQLPMGIYTLTIACVPANLGVQYLWFSMILKGIIKLLFGKKDKKAT